MDDNTAYYQLHVRVLNPLASEVTDNGDPNSFYGSLYAYGETHHEWCLKKYVPLLVEAYQNGGIKELKKVWHDLQWHELMYCHCGDTGSDGKPYEFAKEDIANERYQEDVQALVHKALRDYRSWLLSGEEGPNPIELLGLALNQGFNELHEIRNHGHRWNSDGFCFVCGADGNA